METPESSAAKIVCMACAANDPLYWEDCCYHYYAAASIAQGDGYWPSMISVEFDCEGTITSDDARGLAAMLVRAADACDKTMEGLIA